jgi:hypothetical protein
MTIRLECIGDDAIIILLQRRWFVLVRYEMLAQLENTKMMKFYPRALCVFEG